MFGDGRIAAGGLAEGILPRFPEDQAPLYCRYIRPFLFYILKVEFTKIENGQIFLISSCALYSSCIVADIVADMVVPVFVWHSLCCLYLLGSSFLKRKALRQLSGSE